MDSHEALKLYKEELLQKGIEKGKQEERQEMVLRLVSRRWPELHEEAVQRLEQVTDLGVLGRLFDRLLEAPDLEAARRALQSAAD